MKVVFHPTGKRVGWVLQCFNLTQKVVPFLHFSFTCLLHSYSSSAIKTYKYSRLLNNQACYEK